ncbi:MAG: hypothetical protein IJP27_02485 [Clostridia bacterium]|nr:hypothetical protein [Clostridia bacterium]
MIRSELQSKTKWILGTVGGIAFCGLLSLALIHPSIPKHSSPYELIATRTELAVGESGGFIITNGEDYITDYHAEADTNLLMLNGNSYTALFPGECILTVSHGDQCHSIPIRVIDAPGKDTIVLASPNGEKYHKTTAKHAGKYATQITEEEALQSEKSPCMVCYRGKR